MRPIIVPMLFIALVACSDTPTEFVSPLVVSGPEMLAKTEGHRNHTTQLTGAEEVPPRETPAHGNAVYQIAGDGNSVSYRVIVSNITNVVAAHIHIGPVGANGPVAVWLYPSTSPGNAPAGGGAIQGVIVSGTFSAADLTDAMGAWDGTWESLLAAIRSGGAYTNVHTNDGDDTPNEGPGDFPGGEVRGQFKGSN